MPYFDGMVLVAYSISFWGMAGTIASCVPVLLLTFAASIIISIANDFLGQPENSPKQFYDMIALIFRNRTYQ